MPIKITVNGVDYPSVEAMPAEVRKIYEEMRARFPDLAVGDDAVPTSIVSKDLGPLHLTASVRRNIVVNDRTYDSESAMPPDVRQTYDQAMRAMRSNDPAVKKNELKVTFQLNGPTFRFGAKPADASQPGAIPSDRSAPPASPAGIVTARPIDPTGVLPWRFAYGAAVGVAIVLAWWWLFYR